MGKRNTRRKSCCNRSSSKAKSRRRMRKSRSHTRCLKHRSRTHRRGRRSSFKARGPSTDSYVKKQVANLKAKRKKSCQRET